MLLVLKEENHVQSSASWSIRVGLYGPEPPAFRPRVYGEEDSDTHGKPQDRCVCSVGRLDHQGS